MFLRNLLKTTTRSNIYNIRSFTNSRFNSETAGALSSVLSDTGALQIQSIGKSGLTFSDGVICKGPVMLLDNKIFLWNVPTPNMPFNWGSEVTQDAFKVFEMLTPRPGMNYLRI